MPLASWLIVGVLCLFVVVAVAAFGPLAMLWVRARRGGARVEWIELVGMRLRRVDAGLVVGTLVRATGAGIGVTTNQLETHCLAGGRVDRVLDAMIEARAQGREVGWNDAAARDLAGAVGERRSLGH